MPFTKKDLEVLPMFFCTQNEVWVLVRPDSAKRWQEDKIPMDGRTYKTGGTITFKNGQTFRASFYVDTASTVLIKRDRIYLHVEDVWFGIDEPELLTHLNITKEAMYPLQWQSDRPFDHPKKTPYWLMG